LSGNLLRITLGRYNIILFEIIVQTTHTKKKW
jgi:hypothetical protein